MKTKVQAALFAAFAADALALPVHWIYDTGKLAKEFGRLDQFLKPAEGSYHFGKDKGEYTHYGDQMLVLLESVAACNGFELDDFAQRWQGLFADYHGYVDKATRTTLENFARGASPADAGSPSNDLAGAARMVPLVLCYHHDLDELLRAARQQTQMTHNNPEVIESAEFFARVLWKVLHGKSPLAAIDEVAAGLPTTTSSSRLGGDRQAACRHGQHHRHWQPGAELSRITCVSRSHPAACQTRGQSGRGACRWNHGRRRFRRPWHPGGSCDGCAPRLGSHPFRVGRRHQVSRASCGTCFPIGKLKTKSHAPRRRRVSCSLQLIALSFGCSIAQPTYGSG